MRGAHLKVTFSKKFQGQNITVYILVQQIYYIQTHSNFKYKMCWCFFGVFFLKSVFFEFFGELVLIAGEKNCGLILDSRST